MNINAFSWNFRIEEFIFANSITKFLKEKTMSDSISKIKPEKYDKGSTDLSELLSHTTDKKDWAQDLLYRIRIFRKSKGSSRIAALNQLEKEILSQLNPEDNLDAIWQKTKDMNKEFYQQLRLKHPGLSQNELDFCSLIRMDFPMKDIAVLKSITLKSVNMARYRIKKKLGLEPENDLDEYIQTL